MSIETVATWVGTGMMVAGGLLLAAVALAGAAWATGHYGFRLWRNVTTIYRFESIQYWFKRMQAEGTHVLRKEYHEKAAEADPVGAHERKEA